MSEGDTTPPRTLEPIPPRTLEQIRGLILTMPFVRTLQLQIVAGNDGTGSVSVPISDASTYDGRAFAAAAIGAACDVAAGVAALSTIPADRMLATTKVDTDVFAPPIGTSLNATAVLGERRADTLTLHASAEVRDNDGNAVQCGKATVTLTVL